MIEVLHELFTRPGRRPDRRLRPGADLGRSESPVRLERLEGRVLLSMDRIQWSGSSGGDDRPMES
jgi:hypothetical protein